jgi:1-aminocyclopropane-1-carboxylate deaminase
MKELPRTIATYGGHQSNALRALARIVAKSTDSQLKYYCKEIPKWLKDQPEGIYQEALTLNTQFIEMKNEEYKELTNLSSLKAIEFLSLGRSTLFIPQGGACELARAGCWELADELLCKINSIAEAKSSNAPWKVVIACGTGTTAYFVHERLKKLNKLDIQVVAVPCLGDDIYLKDQMTKLAETCEKADSLRSFPIILSPRKREVFGYPRKELLDIWNEIRETSTGLEFDLIYAPRAFEILFENLDDLNESNLIYYHCGGVEGNESQIKRYGRKKI